MALPNADPSLPSGAAPLFGDIDATRGGQMRANNNLIWGNFTNLDGRMVIVESLAYIIPIGPASLKTVLLANIGHRNFYATTAASDIPSSASWLIDVKWQDTSAHTCIVTATAEGSLLEYQIECNVGTWGTWIQTKNASGSTLADITTLQGHFDGSGNANNAVQLKGYAHTNVVKADWNGSSIDFEVDATPNEPVTNALALHGHADTYFGKQSDVSNLLGYLPGGVATEAALADTLATTHDQGATVGPIKVKSGSVTGSAGSTTVTFASGNFVSYIFGAMVWHGSSGGDAKYPDTLGEGGFHIPGTSLGETYYWIAFGI